MLSRMLTTQFLLHNTHVLPSNKHLLKAYRHSVSEKSSFAYCTKEASLKAQLQIFI